MCNLQMHWGHFLTLLHLFLCFPKGSILSCELPLFYCYQKWIWLYRRGFNHKVFSAFKWGIGSTYYWNFNIYFWNSPVTASNIQSLVYNPIKCWWNVKYSIQISRTNVFIRVQWMWFFLRIISWYFFYSYPYRQAHTQTRNRHSQNLDVEEQSSGCQGALCMAHGTAVHTKLD